MSILLLVAAFSFVAIVVRIAGAAGKVAFWIIAPLVGFFVLALALSGGGR